MSIIKTQTETKVETEVQKKDAKKILFDWADVENEKEISSISKEKLNEFSTAYETDKLKKIYDNYDLVSFVKDTGTNDEKLLKQTQKIEKEFNEVATAASVPATAHIEFQKLSTPKVVTRKNVKAKLNFRGKLMLFGYGAIVAVLGFLAIFNVVQINNLTAQNAQIQSQIQQSENSLSDLYNTYKNLNNENKIAEIVDDKNMIKLESTSNSNISLRPPKEYTKESNWFDKLCNFFSSLFGG